MKVLVTGNKGYIGTVLCGMLLAEGFEVVGLDIGYYGLGEFQPLDYQVKQLLKDVRKITLEDLDDIQAVIHLAALSNDPLGDLNAELTYQINYLGSVKLAQLAKKAGVKRFIFSSSCSLYGIAGQEMINETGTLNPVTAYAKSKVGAEGEIAKLADDKFSPVLLRNSTVYGVSPSLRLDLVVNNLVGWAYATGKIKVMSDGTPWRPLIHVQDVSKAFVAALKAPLELVHNQVFNVGGNSENYQIKDIVRLVEGVVPDCRVVFTGEHGADTRTYRVDFTKLNQTLGKYFKPSWDVGKGAGELYQAYQTFNLKKDNFPDGRFVRLKSLKSLLEQGKLDENLNWKGVR